MERFLYGANFDAGALSPNAFGMSASNVEELKSGHFLPVSGNAFNAFDSENPNAWALQQPLSPFNNNIAIGSLPPLNESNWPEEANEAQQQQQQQEFYFPAYQNVCPLGSSSNYRLWRQCNSHFSCHCSNHFVHLLLDLTMATAVTAIAKSSASQSHSTISTANAAANAAASTTALSSAFYSTKYSTAKSSAVNSAKYKQPMQLPSRPVQPQTVNRINPPRRQPLTVMQQKVRRLIELPQASREEEQTWKQYPTREKRKTMKALSMQCLYFQSMCEIQYKPLSINCHWKKIWPTHRQGQKDHQVRPTKPIHLDSSQGHWDKGHVKDHVKCQINSQAKRHQTIIIIRRVHHLAFPFHLYQAAIS